MTQRATRIARIVCDASKIYSLLDPALLTVSRVAEAEVVEISLLRKQA
jgi:hypothetical protein